MARVKKIEGEENSKEEKTDEEKLAHVISLLDKQYGKGTIILGKTSFPEIEKIKTGSLSLDIALGGGYPRGRILEIYGVESAGKSTLALHAINESQLLNLTCAYIDVEHALDVEYASNLGVDIDKLLIIQPNSAEEALDVADKLLRSSVVKFIVVDSVAALIPNTELEKNVGESVIGRQALLMSTSLKRLAPIVHEQNANILFINQLRSKINVMYGSPETTSGGNALKYYASIRMDIRRTTIISEGEDKIGSNVKVKVVKNKVAPPHKEAEFAILFGKGIDKFGDILTQAIRYNVIQKSGAWFKYNDKVIGQGFEAVIEYIKENQLEEEIRSKLFEKLP